MPWDGVRAAKALHEEDLMARENVVGVAVGHKVIRGQETDEKCIVVFVEQKLSLDDLRKRDRVPPSLDGVRTDVVETGRFKALALSEPLTVSRTTRIRPAPGGVSIGHVKVTAGTLGVRAIRHGVGPVILSNNHVLANGNDASPGDLILQPGPIDGGRAEDAIAKLTDFVPIAFTERQLGPLGRFLEWLLSPVLARAGLGLQRLPSNQTNQVDCAIARPLDEADVSAEILEVGHVAGVREAELGMRVKKSGRTTGLTEGRITAVDAVVEVDYGGKTAVFRQQIVADAMSKGGDSGSLVLDEKNRAVGLLFAGSTRTTLMNPIGTVLKLLDLSL